MGHRSLGRVGHLFQAGDGVFGVDLVLEGGDPGAAVREVADGATEGHDAAALRTRHPVEGMLHRERRGGYGDPVPLIRRSGGRVTFSPSITLSPWGDWSVTGASGGVTSEQGYPSPPATVQRVNGECPRVRRSKAWGMMLENGFDRLGCPLGGTGNIDNQA